MKVTSVKYHPTKDLFISGSEDKLIKVWFKEPYGVNFSLYTFLEGHKAGITSVKFDL